VKPLDENFEWKSSLVSLGLLAVLVSLGLLAELVPFGTLAVLVFSGTVSSFFSSSSSSSDEEYADFFIVLDGGGATTFRELFSSSSSSSLPLSLDSTVLADFTNFLAGCCCFFGADFLTFFVRRIDGSTTVCAAVG